jgi:hypothetical protein
MSEPEKFLSRWFRRKQQAAEGDDAAPSESEPAPPDIGAPSVAATGVAPPDVAALEALVESRARGDAVQPPAASAVPDEPTAAPFDPTTLPSIESITAETDIRAFLAPGVPPELALAALRRAWSADPAIRDFVGLADYAWDYHAVGSMAGFGPLEMTDELRQMVARIMGQGAEGEAAQTPSAAVVPDDKGETALPDPTKENPAAIGPEASVTNPENSQNCDESPHSSEKHAAVQYSPEKDEDLQSSARRSHGGALPK